VVGGGFRNHGGHNPLEPVIAGTPAIFGRHFRHFEPEAAALTSTEPNSRVTDPNRLGELVVQWMSDETRRAEALMNQRRALPDASAIEKRYLQTLAPWLEERCA
jgi:3-deoxy-D-manno-octulosonic-acid transferase